VARIDATRELLELQRYLIASFVPRFVYQQLTWNITQDKMQANFLRTRGVFGGASQQATELRRRFENAAGLAFEDFLHGAHVLYGLFLRSSSFGDYQLVEAMRSRSSFRARLNVCMPSVLSIECSWFLSYCVDKSENYGFYYFRTICLWLMWPSLS
jgi:hypothetical protein